MKKIALFVIPIIFASSLAAQGVRMGLIASPQLSWMKSDASKITSDGPQFGFNFGLVTDFFFAERYSFSTGLMINNTGGKLNYADSLHFSTNDGTYDLQAGSSIKYKIQYLDIPLAFRMESNQIGYFLFYAQFGVTNQIRLSASADIEGVNEMADADGNTVTEDISLSGSGCKDEINPFYMGYNIGGGMNYYFSKNTALTLGVLYTNGFIDVTSNNYPSDNNSLRSIMLKVGVLF